MDIDNNDGSEENNDGSEENVLLSKHMRMYLQYINGIIVPLYKLHCSSPILTCHFVSYCKHGMTAICGRQSKVRLKLQRNK